MQSNPHKLTVIDGETLMDKRLPPTKFCVDTLLPQGLCILGGSPKVGNEGNELATFKNLFNEWYVRDTSKKIRAVVKAKAERGERVGTVVPYGYRKDPDDKGHLLVNEDTAPVVRLIFSLCAEGKGPKVIANILREKQILKPTAYDTRPVVSMALLPTRKISTAGTIERSQGSLITRYTSDTRSTAAPPWYPTKTNAKRMSRRANGIALKTPTKPLLIR